MCCISPILAVKLLPGCEVTVGQDKECEMYVNPCYCVFCVELYYKRPVVLFTVYRWPYAQTAGVVKDMGCKHVNKDVDEVHVDVKNKLVTTCAFMCNAPVHKVFDGVGVMVKETLKLA